MKPMRFFLGACLSLLLLVGMAAQVSAQQPASPADTIKTESAPAKTDSAPAKTESAPAQPGGADKNSPTPPAAQSPGQQSQPKIIERQVETRTERVERQPARILGMDPTVAAVIGAALLVVIVLGLVAMSRREDPHHTRA